MKRTEIFSIGIDVSKAKLDIAILHLVGEKQALETTVIPNEEGSIQAFIKSLGENFCGKIICESTGRYHLLLALCCVKAGLDLRVVNPLLAKKHTSSSIRKNKSDKADSKILAQMAITESSLPKKFTKTKTDIMIRQKLGLIQSLGKQIQSFGGMIKGYEEIQSKLKNKLSTTEKSLLEILKNIKAQKKTLERELEGLIETKAQEKKDEEVLEILQTIPGVSAYFSRIIYQFFDPSCTSAKQWIAFTGMDISVNQSGQRNGRTKISKRGNSYLRQRFFTAAWGAVMNYEPFKIWYDFLRDTEKRSYREALLIIARKIIRLAYALIHSRQEFDSSLSLFSSKKF